MDEYIRLLDISRRRKHQTWTDISYDPTAGQVTRTHIGLCVILREGLRFIQPMNADNTRRTRKDVALIFQIVSTS